MEIGKKWKMAEMEIFIHQKSALESLKVSWLIPLNIASYGLVEHIQRKPVEKASVIGDRLVAKFIYTMTILGYAAMYGISLSYF